MRQVWERIKCAFLLGPRFRGSLTEPVATVRWPTLVGLNAVAVVVAALALAGGRISRRRYWPWYIGRVIKQSPGPGAVRAAGTPVNLVVGRL
jgi:hypothetical protein